MYKYLGSIFRRDVNNVSYKNTENDIITKFSFLFFVAVIAMSFCTARIFQNAQNNEAIAYSERLAQQAGNTLDVFFSDLDSYVRILAVNQDIIDRFYGENAQPSELGSLQNMIAIQRLLADFSQRDSGIHSISVFSRHEYITNDNYKWYDRTDTYLHTIMDEVDCYEEIFVHYFLAHTVDYYYLESNPPSTFQVISLVCPIRNIYKQHSRNLGYVLIDLDVKKLDSFIKSTKWNDKQQVLIVNQDNRVVFSENQEMFPISEPLNYPRLCGDVQNQTVKIDGSNYLVSSASVELNQWKILVLTDKADMEAAAKQNILIVAIVAVGTLLLVVLVASPISDNITKPIYGLVSKMDNIRNRDRLEININPPPKMISTEIEALYSGYNMLVDEIFALIAENYEAALMQKDAELKTLQAQINPHFLNNILQMIQGLAVMGKDDLIRIITADMGELLEYSVYETNSIVPLSKELDYIKRYVNIQNMRLETPIHLQINVAPQLEFVRVPKFILQPIVENSVIHGFEGLDLKEMRVCAEYDERYIYLIVQDNGIGIPPTLLGKILSSDYFEAAHTVSSVGLKNINERIKLLYGSEYGLTITSEVGKGTFSKLVLPVKLLKGEDDNVEGNRGG